MVAFQCHAGQQKSSFLHWITQFNPQRKNLLYETCIDNTWTFRHIYRGQPKRHLLTTGWSLFVASKRLKTGEAVLFIRAFRSEFVIPLAKYRKSLYGTQLSVGMSFGMMFETEESGTIVGISDLDPLRWPGSKWRNLQVEWEEAGCDDKQNRVSSWEIETPGSLFMFPALTSGLKRPLHSGFLENDWGSLIRRPFSTSS
ncbi:Auxin response factor [Quillaja saponaria]|uniref:Auxin response factor n=1 Tax=Quillaja saponaria TaxID=32244 RepID=A0AAD7LIS0_QUISA|nr:Auxin response factor [Quillaja saponaria]